MSNKDSHNSTEINELSALIIRAAQIQALKQIQAVKAFDAMTSPIDGVNTPPEPEIEPPTTSIDTSSSQLSKASSPSWAKKALRAAALVAGAVFVFSQISSISPRSKPTEPVIERVLSSSIPRPDNPPAQPLFEAYIITLDEIKKREIKKRFHSGIKMNVKEELEAWERRKAELRAGMGGQRQNSIGWPVEVGRELREEKESSARRKALIEKHNSPHFFEKIIDSVNSTIKRLINKKPPSELIAADMEFIVNGVTNSGFAAIDVAENTKAAISHIASETGSIEMARARPLLESLFDDDALSHNKTLTGQDIDNEIKLNATRYEALAQNKEQYDEAVTLFKDSGATLPDNPALLALHMYTINAIEERIKVINSSPENTPALSRLADALEQNDLTTLESFYPALSSLISKPKASALKEQIEGLKNVEETVLYGQLSAMR